MLDPDIIPSTQNKEATVFVQGSTAKVNTEGESSYRFWQFTTRFHDSETNWYDFSWQKERDNFWVISLYRKIKSINIQIAVLKLLWIVHQMLTEKFWSKKILSRVFNIQNVWNLMEGMQSN